MTFMTNDYLEYYLTLLGWIINNGAWNMISDAGLSAVPSVAVVMCKWLKVHGKGANEGNKGVLSLARIETHICVGYIVVALTGIPVINVSLDTIEFDQAHVQQCQYSLSTPVDISWPGFFSGLVGENVQMPLWWAMMHALSKGFTAGAVAAIPCGTDPRQTRMEVDNMRVNNPLLAQEIADFSKDYYSPSRARLFMRQPDLGFAVGDNKALQDLNWIGPRFLLNTPGCYDTDYSKTPRQSWPYNTTYDAGLLQVGGGGGYPTCKQWWVDSGIGLCDRIKSQVDPDLVISSLKWAKWMNQDEVTGTVIRQVISPSSQVKGNAYTGYGGQVGGMVWNGIARTAGIFGVALGSLAYSPAMDMVRQALPTMMSFPKMAMVVCISIVLVIGTYQLKVAMTMTTVFFVMVFVDFWFQLARYTDSMIPDAFYGSGSPHLSFDPVMGLNTTTQDAILNLMMGVTFIILPLLWITVVGWSGIQTGTILDGLADGTRGVQEAGGKAGERTDRSV